MAKVTFTDEYRKRLDGLLAIRADRTMEYTPKDMRDLPAELQASFKLQALGGSELQYILDCARNSSPSEKQEEGFQVADNIGAIYGAICDKCIVGWKGLRDIDGNEVLFPKSNPSKYLPYALMLEVGGIAVQLGRVSEEEVLGLQ